MPAAAALSSSSRQRKNSASRRGSAAGRGRGLSREPSRSSASFTGASSRNLSGSFTGGSQRNLMRHSLTTTPRQRRNDGPHTESMPKLSEGRDKGLDYVRNCLDDSMKSNPELYMSGQQQQQILDDSNRSDDDDSFNVVLRQRPSVLLKRPENGGRDEGDSRQTPDRGRGEAPNHVQLQHGESTPSRTKNKLGSSHVSTDSFKSNPAPDRGTASLERRTSIVDRAPLRPLNDARKFAGRVINDERVQNMVLLLIVINAIMMGIATFPSIKNDPDVIAKFELCDKIFLWIFTVESSLQLLYHGWKLFKDGFLVFDLLIVVMSWALTGAQVFRAFRIFRAMRLITRIDTLKNLVLALFSVVPKMTAIFMLLMLIFYIFSVMFTQLFKGMYDEGLVEYPYFESLYGTLFTLFQMMTLDEWYEILDQLQPYFVWAWLPFVVFIIITGFVVVNLIIAVICDAVHVLERESKMNLHGYDSDAECPPNMEAMSQESDGNNAMVEEKTTEIRLKELQQQLDDMVLVQEQMQATIELLIRQLRESAAREVARLPIDEDRGEVMSRFRTSKMPPTDQRGDDFSHSSPVLMGGEDLLGGDHIKHSRTADNATPTILPGDSLRSSTM